MCRQYKMPSRTDFLIYYIYIYVYYRHTHTGGPLGVYAALTGEYQLSRSTLCFVICPDASRFLRMRSASFSR